MHVGFSETKSKVLKALSEGAYSHEGRNAIDEKNKLAIGEVTADFVANLISRSTGADYTCSPHHQDPRTEVHLITKNGWYVKFYFMDSDALFISVHPA